MRKNSKISRIKRIENELVKRKNSPLRNYNKEKIHLKQIAFHKCNKKNRWVFGGNRSGKTECGAVECVWIARGIHPYKENKNGTIGWVVSLSTQVQRDVAQSKILNYLEKGWIEEIIMITGKKGSPKLGVIDQIIIKNVFGGTSTIGFKSVDQGREKFQGTSLDYVWFDEEPPYDIYEECLMRTFDKSGEIFGTMTPLKGLSWVYDEIYLKADSDSDIWCEFMEWADNPYLPKQEILKLQKSLSSEQLEARRYGRFQSNCGLVYN
ncbi:MAG: terminase family protein, partial [Bacilli bacterium]